MHIVIYYLHRLMYTYSIGVPGYYMHNVVYICTYIHILISYPHTVHNVLLTCAWGARAL